LLRHRNERHTLCVEELDQPGKIGERAGQPVDLVHDHESIHPVTFRQSLFESYYVARPSVPVEVAGRVLPKLDTGGIGGALGARDAATPSPAPQQKSLAMARSTAEAAPAQPPSASAPARIEAAQTAESETQTVFTLPYKVSVAAGQSLVLPITRS
jgi:hypothetical protein